MIGVSDTLRRVIPIYIILIIYIFLSSFIKCTSLEVFFLSFINPLLLIMISFFTYRMTNDLYLRNRKKNIKFKNILIVLCFYLLIYYLSGLIFGFIKNDSFNIINISLLISILLEEFIRYRLLLVSNKKNNYILLTLLFIILDINILSLINNISSYLLVDLIPIILINTLSTYLCVKVNLLSNLIYRGIIFIISIMPLIPDLEWGLNSILLLVLVLFSIYNINRIDHINDRKSKRRKSFLEKSLFSYGLVILSVLFLMFIIGFFKYQPIAILSNSMKDYYARGDIVIIEKVKSSDIDNIKEKDIIYYRYGNRYITHRVVDIVLEDGNHIFYTKGDNNNDVDPWSVKESDIVGVVKGRIKYLGWPSVWVYELLS